MTAATQALVIEQGATFIWSFRLQHPDDVDPDLPGDPVDLTDWVARMQIRKQQQSAALVSATTVNGKIVIGKDPDDPDAPADPLNGWVWVELSDEDTDLLVNKSALYDIELEDTDGRVYRIYKGAVTVDPNITQESDDPVVNP